MCPHIDLRPLPSRYIKRNSVKRRFRRAYALLHSLLFYNGVFGRSPAARFTRARRPFLAPTGARRDAAQSPILPLLGTSATGGLPGCMGMGGSHVRREDTHLRSSVRSNGHFILWNFVRTVRRGLTCDDACLVDH